MRIENERKIPGTTIIKFSCFLLPGIFLATVTLAQQLNRITQNKPTILLVGFHHLDDSLVNILSPQRQREVAEVVARLKTFQPTKIAVERNVFENDTLNDRFSKYVKGKYAIDSAPERFVNTKLETYQIGFRLAKELHHEKIYGIDYRNFPNHLPPVDSFARAYNQEVFLWRFEEGGNDVGKPMEEIIRDSSTLCLLQFLNADSTVPRIDQALLSSLVHIGKDANYIGTDHMLQWFERNLKIYTNITRIIESNDDRILVLIGAAHLNSLRWFITGSGEYNLEKADRYLR